MSWLRASPIIDRRLAPRVRSENQTGRCSPASAARSFAFWPLGRLSLTSLALAVSRILMISTGSVVAVKAVDTGHARAKNRARKILSVRKLGQFPPTADAPSGTASSKFCPT